MGAGAHPAGTRHAEPVTHIDLVPTVAAAAGAALPTDRPIDGGTCSPTWPRAAAAAAVHAALARQYRTVVDGQWKLIAAHRR